MNRFPRLAAVTGLSLLVGLGWLALYMRERPDLPSPMAGAAASHGSAAQVRAAVERLAEALNARPNDVVGWGMLGRSYNAMGRHDDAAAALRRAIDLGASDPATMALLGEALVRANEGTIVREARAAFQAALKADPRDPQSRFFLGLARLQEGDARSAVAIWRDLESDAEPSAPWLPVVRQQIRSVAAHAGFDPAMVPPSRPTARIGAQPKPAAPAFVPLDLTGRRQPDLGKGG